MGPVALHLGDCLDVLKGVANHSIDLAYLDPPFFTQRTHRLSSRDGKRLYSFEDIWKSHSEYVGFLVQRVQEVHRTLKETGSIFFHCNDQSSHLARFVLDEIFGTEMFRSEIIWSYRRWSNSHRGLLPAHQTIFFYSRSVNFKFNPLLTDYSASTNIEQILQKRERDHRGKAVYARDAQGSTVSNGPKKGVPLSDVWDIPYLNPKAKERVGYPTQKPILLLDRIISLCSDPGEVILDPFCGSGTTVVAAQLSGRNAIGIDISEDALELTRSRLANPVATHSRLLEFGREEYVRDDVSLLAVLQGIDFHPVQRNKGVDAILKKQFKGRPVFLRIQRNGEPLDQAMSQLRKSGVGKGDPLLVVIATDPNLQQNTYGKNVIIVTSTNLGLQIALNSPECEDRSVLPLFQRFG